MKNIITFIIPVMHPENVTDWNSLKGKLNETVQSISRQDGDGWKAVVVANHQAQLPDLPKGFEVKRVDFPPNQLFRQGNAEKEQFYEACRLDKGRRILAGMLYVGDMSAGYVMIVDADDFISRRITSFVKSHWGANGWYVRDGYIWNDGGLLMYHHSDFSHICGTSHIIRADLYKLPSNFDEVDEVYIRRVLGSHRFIYEDLDASGKPLEPLPFLGAVYRTGHAESHSQLNTILRQFVLRRYLLKDPLELFRRISRLRIKTKQINREFFGILN